MVAIRTTTAPRASSASAQPDPADVSARRTRVARGAAGLVGDNCARDQSHSSPDQHGRQGDQHRIPGRLEGDLPPERTEPPEPEPCLSGISADPGRGEHGEGEEDHDALSADEELAPAGVRRPVPRLLEILDRRARGERRIHLSQSSVQLGDARRKLRRLRRIERVEIQRYRPGERAEEPAHLRPSRELLDADADEDALGGGGRADEGSERCPSRSRHGPGHGEARRGQRRARPVERDELTAPRTAARGQSSRPRLQKPFRIVDGR